MGMGEARSRMKCVICESEIETTFNGWDQGHNAEPVAKGRCCGECNQNKVIPKRLKGLLVEALDNEVSVNRLTSFIKKHS